MFDRLVAEEAFADLADEMAVYGRLVGSWDIVSTWFRDGHEDVEREGYWHFSSILGGRAIQDILYVKGAAPHEAGTTIRCYDATLGAWRVVWMQPSGREFVSLIGRAVGDTIVQEGAPEVAGVLAEARGDTLVVRGRALTPVIAQMAGVSRRYERRVRVVRQAGDTVETRRFSPGRTVGLVLGGAAAVAVALLLGLSAAYANCSAGCG